VPSSSAFLVTNESFSLEFEKHTRGIRSQLFFQMEYIYGGHGKSGHGIVVPIYPKIILIRARLGSGETSLLDGGYHTTTSVLFVECGIHSIVFLGSHPASIVSLVEDDVVEESLLCDLDYFRHEMRAEI
jgi:hypothetical protein